MLCLRIELHHGDLHQPIVPLELFRVLCGVVVRRGFLERGILGRTWLVTVRLTILVPRCKMIEQNKRYLWKNRQFDAFSLNSIKANTSVVNCLMDP